MAGRTGSRFIDDDYDRRYSAGDERDYRAAARGGGGGDYYHGYAPRSDRDARDLEWDRGRGPIPGSQPSGGGGPPMGRSLPPRGGGGGGGGYDVGYYDDRGPTRTGPPPGYLDLPPSRGDLGPPEVASYRSGGGSIVSSRGGGGGGVDAPLYESGARASSLDATGGLLSSLEATIGSSGLAGLASRLSTSFGQMNPVVRGQCLLLPPPSTSSAAGKPAGARAKPPFCKTVFVGHLPQNTTRQALMDIFEPCGAILSLRFNPRNHFAHVQFDSEDAVDKAMDFSNYSIKVDLTGDPGSMGKIIVDYAVSRGDVPPEADPERAAEIQARRRAREARHRESGKRERSPTQATPPPFTESASAEVKEKFRVDDGAEEASRTLVFWLEKGICNRHNTDKFFPLVQSADGCMKRVMRSKKDHEIDVRRFIADSQLKQDCLKRQIIGVSKIFGLLDKQDKKLYDLFTRAQRKLLTQWASDSKALKSDKWFNLLCITNEANMVSMDEEEQRKRDGREPESKRAKTDDADKHLKSVKDELSKVKSHYKEKLESREKEIAKLKEMLGKSKSDSRKKSVEKDAAKKETTTPKKQKEDEIPPDSDAEEGDQLQQQQTGSNVQTVKEGGPPKEKEPKEATKSKAEKEGEGREEVPMVIDDSEPVLQIVEEDTGTAGTTTTTAAMETAEVNEEVTIVTMVTEEEKGIPEAEESKDEVKEEPKEESAKDVKQEVEVEESAKERDGIKEKGEESIKEVIGDKEERDMEEVGVKAEKSRQEDEEKAWEVNNRGKVENDEAVSSLMAVVGVLASFLSVHPYGAVFSDIQRYVESLNCPLSSLSVWSALCRASAVFSSHPQAEKGKPVGDATWYFNGYQTLANVTDELLALH